MLSREKCLRFIQGENTLRFQKPVTKLFAKRIWISYRSDSSDKNMNRLVEEVQRFFESNQALVQSDLNAVNAAR